MKTNWSARFKKGGTASKTETPPYEVMTDEEFQRNMDESPGVNALRKMLEKHKWKKTETLPFETLEDHMMAAYLIARKQITPPPFVVNRIHSAIRKHVDNKSLLMTQEEFAVLHHFGNTTKNLAARPKLPYGDEPFHKTIRRTGQDAERVKKFAANCVAKLKPEKNINR